MINRNSVALKLNGVILVEHFAEAIGGFSDLVRALSKEVAGPAKVDWHIKELSTGSAEATLEGISETEDVVMQVVDAYQDVGGALAHNAPLAYSPEVVSAAFRIVGVLKNDVASVVFITANQREEISDLPTESKREIKRLTSMGTIVGVAESLLRHPGLRLSLRDDLFEKIVDCYLSSDYEELMRKVWGKRVAVTGLIERHPLTGRPVEIRQVSWLEIIEDTQPGGYKLAAGALSWKPGDEPAEVTIRRIRDAE